MFTFLFVILGLCTILGFCGLIADYILPHFKALNRFIDSLPMMW